MSKSPHRSFAHIDKQDLERLSDIALHDFDDLFRRRPYSHTYKSRLLLICLCQGAARHYVHGDRGVHDFDLWGFFEELPDHPFPYRRQGSHDFGQPKFGHNPEDGDRYVGRQVGVFGRSIGKRRSETNIQAVQRWLRDAHTESSKLLAQQPAVVIWPRSELGRIVWDSVAIDHA
jgi:hypothetical protein